MRRSLLFFFIVVTGIIGGFLTQQWWENRHTSQSEQLFVYGTLTNPWIRFYACRCLTPNRPLTITGVRVEDRNLHPAAPNDVVYGQLLTVTPVELTRFDRYERVPARYTRVRATFIDSEPWIYLRNNHTIDIP